MSETGPDYAYKLNAAVGFGLWDTHPEIQLWPVQIKPPERIGKGIWL
jgi:hypothetical protein